MLSAHCRTLVPGGEMRVAGGSRCLRIDDPERFRGFSERYREELRGRVERINELRVRASHGPVTIVHPRATQSTTTRWSSSSLVGAADAPVLG